VVLRFLSILFFLAGVAATAQSDCSYRISGKVTHTANIPLTGAVIYVVETHTGTTTDERGRYVMEELCAGKYTLICRYVGHQPDTITVSLSQSLANQDFHLAETPETLETVVVQANRESSPTLQSQQTLQGIELQKVQGASLGEMLKALPGLNSIQTGPSISKPVIHGLHSNRVLILNNGIRQEGQQWGSEHAPEIDPFVAKKVTVVKGAAGVRYGADAIGGVILVEPESLPTTAPIRGEVNLQALSNNRQGTASGVLEGGVKKWSGFGWRLQGTYKKAGTSQTPDYYLTNSQFQEQNFSASAGYQINKYGISAFYSHFATQLGIFSGAHIGNQTDLEKALRSDRPLVVSAFSYHIDRPYQDVSHDLLKAQAYYHSAIGKWSLVSGYQYNFRREWDRLSALRKTDIRFRLYTYTNELLLEHKPLGNLTGTVGLSTIYQGNDVGGNVRLIPNFNSFNAGVFLIERWSRKQWELEAGLRYDYRQLDVYRRESSSQPVVATNFTFTNLSGSLGAVYQPRTNLELRLNLSSAWRPPTAAELYSDGVHHGAAAYEKGDTSLTTERSYHATLSTVWTVNDRLTAEIGIYYNYMPGYIYLKPDSLPQLTIRGAFPAYTYTQTDAAFRGADVTVHYRLLSWLTWQGKLAMVRARNLTQNEYLPWIPTDRIENTLRAEMKKWKRFSNLYLSFGTLNVSQQRRIPPTYAQTTEQNGVTRTLYIGDFAPPPAGYMLFQADAGISFAIRKHTMDVSLAAQNLTNVRYRDYLNRFRYFADEMGRNMTIKLKYSF
jgi:iron complex outermembrane receptor protein